MPVLLLGVLPFAIALGIVIYFGRRFAKAFELNRGAIRESGELTRRLTLLEEQVEVQNQEILRLSEGLKFHDQLVPNDSTARLK